ncbi:hypothetical protein HY383_02745 [Candidatus Daviesbacteria bacterium]|nr:hypothetical protein [Candidatus Daviesbacteria bacterium]
MKIGIERIGSKIKRLANDAYGISAYTDAYQHPEKFDESWTEKPLRAAVCAVTYELLFPSGGRLGRKYGAQLSKPTAFTTLIRDGASLISALVDGKN